MKTRDIGVEKEIIFDYFRGMEAEAYAFYRIPKILFTDGLFRNISSEAKILYGLMLDRMSLSIRNGWLDGENRVYIYFTVDEAMEMLNIGKNKAIRLMAELDCEGGIGLIERKRQGQGKPSMIYVKNFIIKEGERFENKTTEDDSTNPEVYESNHRKSQNETSGGLIAKPQEVCISSPNNTDFNNTDTNKNEIGIIQSDIDGADTMGNDWSYLAELIKGNLELDTLKRIHPYESATLDGIYNLVLETVLSRDREILIARNRYPGRLVREKFLRLNSSHVEYVLAGLRQNMTKVRNIKKYMLAALFNAPSTIDSYYQAEVNHDML